MTLTLNLLCSETVLLAVTGILLQLYRRTKDARRVRRGLRLYVSSALEQAA